MDSNAFIQQLIILNLAFWCRPPAGMQNLHEQITTSVAALALCLLSIVALIIVFSSTISAHLVSFSRQEHAFRPIISSQTNIGIVSLVSLYPQDGFLYATVQSSSTCSRWPTTSTCFVSVFSRPATRLSLAMTTLVSQ